MRSVTIRLLLVLATVPLPVLGQTVEPRSDASVTITMRRPPIFFDRKELTDAQVALIDEEREINNLNILLDRPATGEEIVLGSIRSIDCDQGRVYFQLVSNGNVLTLTSPRFDDIKFSVLTAGTRAFTFRCDANFLDDTVAAVFRPAAKQPGTLRSLTIVPANFRLKSLAQIDREPAIIIQGMPPTEIAGNELKALKERDEMQRIMKEAEERNRLDRADKTGAVPEKPT